MTNGTPNPEPAGIPRARPVAPFAVVAELSVLYEISSLGFAESEEQLGREAAEKASRLFGARYFALLRGPLLQQKPVVMWGVRNENDLKPHLMRPGPNQFRFSFPLGGNEVATVFAEQARPVDDRETRLYTILARRIQATMTALKNIAEKERALDNARRSEERLQAVIRSMGEALIVTDAQGRVELINPAAETLTGWTAADAIGTPVETVFQIFHEETRQPMENPAARMLRGNSAESHKTGAILLARGGTERPISFTGHRITNENGDPLGVVLIFADQTEEQAIRRNLQKAKCAAQNYFQSAGVLMMVLDRDGKIVTLNRRGEDLLGAKADEVCGADWFEKFLPEKIRSETRRYFGDLMSDRFGPTEQHHENPIVTADGAVRLIAWHNTVLRDEHGQPTGVLCSGTDVTDERAAQSKLEEQVQELRRWYRATLGRENTILQLKKEVNELCRKLGEPPRYQTTA